MTCPRCGRWSRLLDLRMYDYRAGWICTGCETAADKVIPGAWLDWPASLSR